MSRNINTLVPGTFMTFTARPSRITLMVSPSVTPTHLPVKVSDAYPMEGAAQVTRSMAVNRAAFGRNRRL